MVLVRAPFLVVAVVGILLWHAGAASAHRPYLRDLVPWVGPDGTPYQIGMLFGDGIVASDPGRPVVLDSSQKVIALGPLTHDGFAACVAPSECRLLTTHLKAVPAPESFRAGRPADFYPEHEREEYGFKLHPHDWADTWIAWTVPFRRTLAGTIVLLLVFGSIGRVIAAVLAMSVAWLRAPAWRTLTTIVLAVMAAAGAGLVGLFLAYLLHWSFLSWWIEIAVIVGTASYGLTALRLAKARVC